MSTARFILARYTTSATTTRSPALNASLKMMPRRKISPPLLLSRYRAKADFTPPIPRLCSDCALCDQHGIMLIADEVQSGAGDRYAVRHGTDGRCGRYYHVCEIDRRRLSAGRRYRPGRRDGRYRAGRAGRHLRRKPDCLRRRAGGTDIFEQENLLQKANTLGNTLRDGLMEIAETHREIGDVRGLGAMIAIELFENGDPGKPNAALTADIVTRAREKGLILLSCGLTTTSCASSFHSLLRPRRFGKARRLSPSALMRRNKRNVQ